MHHSLQHDQFSNEELIRYSRHFSLEGVGLEGQSKLKNARVLCIGAGALGSVVLPILTSAGIGKIGVADDDLIELSNLQRQTLYRTNEVGRYKVIKATERLRAINPEISIVTHQLRVTAHNAVKVIENYDYVIDCTDNLESRYLLSAVCVHQKIPYIYGGIYQFTGQCSVLSIENAPCYHCLFPECPPSEALPNCAQAGVLSSLPAIIGALQTNELFKQVLGIGEGLLGKLLTVDALTLSIQCYQVRPRSDCEVCANKDTEFNLSCLLQQPVNCDLSDNIELPIAEAKQRLSAKTIELLDVRELYERELSNIGGHHIPLADVINHIETIRALKKPILVYCASGKRSRQAVQWLRQNKIESYSLKGGINALHNELVSVDEL